MGVIEGLDEEPALWLGQVVELLTSVDGRIADDRQERSGRECGKQLVSWSNSIVAWRSDHVSSHETERCYRKNSGVTVGTTGGSNVERESFEGDVSVVEEHRETRRR